MNFREIKSDKAVINLIGNDRNRKISDSYKTFKVETLTQELAQRLGFPLEDMDAEILEEKGVWKSGQVRVKVIFEFCPKMDIPDAEAPQEMGAWPPETIS